MLTRARAGRRAAPHATRYRGARHAYGRAHHRPAARHHTDRPSTRSDRPTTADLPALASPPSFAPPTAPAAEPATRCRPGSRPVDRLRDRSATLLRRCPPRRAALRDPRWRAAMQEEYDALQRNGTWELVPRPPSANVITGKWVFKHKLGSDLLLSATRARRRGIAAGLLHRYICPGCQTGHDPHGVAPRRVSRVAGASMDVSNASFMATEQVAAPVPAHRGFSHQLGFRSTRSDASLFVYRTGNDMAYLLLSVDDII
ncbi:hypothetical protein QYE76_026316 [Lolium multiflorum]|uniref:Reverse transcriptase Ty1/copia-type domain-containing protein n=1 Tax=Lolium multiflorum TaxID=4521 RepID=A0AAD8RII2_LOLMU|nr:hypothetical protein QYE76_026316 [Lolium multiflorum]